MIFDSLIKPALDSVTALINEFHLSPEDKAKAQQAIADAQDKARTDALEYDAKLNDIAGQNIRADAQNGDKFTSRARPTFMYIVESILGFNYIIIPLAKLFGSHVDPIVLPSDLLTLFGVCVTGYAMSRTVEKVASLPGDSQINVLGMKIGNKS
jgi:hypothetical protein